MRPKKLVVDSESILQDIGRTHFPTHKYFNCTYRLKKGGEEYTICYKWEEMLCLYPGCPRSGDYDTMHRCIAVRHRALTKTTGRLRMFSIKPMVHVLGYPLTDWQKLGAKRKRNLFPNAS
jgi:hypothetical protein